MKQNYLLFASIMLLLFTGCGDDSVSYPESAMPEIIVERNELYSVPNRKFVIKANLKDDLGLKSIKINIPEFYLDKEILFSTDELIVDYDLAYEFLVPNDTQETEKYNVNLTLTDVSGNTVSKTLTLNLNGDFIPPVLKNLKPTDGTVLFLTDNMTLNVSFYVTDATGIDYVEVIAESLGINEKITLSGAKEYKFDKTYSIPNKLETYAIAITVADTFVESNTKTTKINFSVADGLSEMYLADVPKETDLNGDILGVPMYYHSKRDGVFIFKYYADTDNKEIYILGQETSFEPHCFGALENNKLENSVDANPIVLVKKGYYEIAVDVSSMTYTTTRYTPTSTVYDPAHITICGNGIETGGWDPNNTDLLLSANPENPYQLQRSLTLTGSDVAMTITSPNWGSPHWRLDASGIIVYQGGANHSYTGQTGNYKFVMDTELERAILVKE